MKQGSLGLAPASLDDAMAMSDGEVQVFKHDEDERWFCVLSRGALKIGVELAEEIPGSGDKSVFGLEVRPVDGSLTVAGLRDAPYGDVIRTARSEVQKVAAGRRTSALRRPGDPPAAFRADRRGRAPRTEEDYAQLAWAYLAMPKDSRRRAAAIWADRFPESGSKRTWLNRLVRAKRFVEEEELTDEGMALVFGHDWQERFEFDHKWDSALNIATMTPGGEIWRRLQRDGKDPRAWQHAAQQAIRVDAEGRPFPKHSPETPQKCGELQ
jgi:hypothetical protein